MTDNKEKWHLIKHHSLSLNATFLTESQWGENHERNPKGHHCYGDLYSPLSRSLSLEYFLFNHGPHKRKKIAWCQPTSSNLSLWELTHCHALAFFLVFKSLKYFQIAVFVAMQPWRNSVSMLGTGGFWFGARDYGDNGIPTDTLSTTQPDPIPDNYPPWCAQRPFTARKPKVA